METERIILHCDCNAYFASVESIDRPELRLVPMAVCGDPKSRHGIILAKNELAKKYGVTTAETVWQAKRKCPNLVLIQPSHGKYGYYSKKINAIYQEFTDRVEPFGVDESWLDMTGCLAAFPGGGKEFADYLRRRIREEFQLTISVGVSFNKVFAKLGSDYKKPDATTVISRENFHEIVFPLPAQDMLFVGKSAAAALSNAGILTIGDIARAGKALLTTLLGRMGETIWLYASGLDDSPVRLVGEVDQAKSVGNSITFCRNLTGWADIRAGLTMLCDSVGSRLRKHALYCTTVQVQIKDPSLKTIQRQKRLDAATNATSELLAAAMSIVEAVWDEKRPIRLLSVTATQLTEEGAVQMRLVDDDSEKRMKATRLDRAIDTIRLRYGKEAISYGNTIQQDIVIHHSHADEKGDGGTENGADAGDADGNGEAPDGR